MSKLRRDTQVTRQQLLDAAERLFAERGIDNVSLIEIGRAAGQKNRNAAQYHFSDKATLVNAVLDRHTDQIAARRRDMLDALAHQPEVTLADAVAIFVRPVAEHVARTENSLAFLLINSQLMISQEQAHVADSRVTTMPEVKELSDLFARLQPQTSAATRRAQTLLIRSMLHHGLASYHTRYGDRDDSAFVEALCTGIEAVLRS
ncbi:MAG: TetR family transcriptional regulator [Pseudomonadota bacterium]